MKVGLIIDHSSILVYQPTLSGHAVAFFTFCKENIKLNLIALKKAKIVYNFGLSECNRVKVSYEHIRLKKT